MYTLSNQTGGNATQMISDITQILKLTFTTKFGITMFMLLLSIYLFSLWMTGATGMLGIGLSIIALIGFIVMSFLTWFNGGGVQEEGGK